MPKEFIHNAYFGQTAQVVNPDGTETPTAIDSSVIKIGWGRDSNHCEIAIVADPDSDTAEFEARHSQLDRAAINRLIRTLRKARDAAFGSDA